jgi:ABC-type transport system involved in multi-copper enzyme maturation permease subunit
MIWVTWRQFRLQAFTALIILAAATIYCLITGFQMHHAYTTDLASCTAQNNCGTAFSQLQRHYNAEFMFAQVLVIVAPAVIGVFWGAPLIARELESGTHQLAWNQSVTRTRWLTVKLTGVGLASVATAGLLSYLTTWWAGPLDQINGGRFDATTFSSRDVVPLGYAAFAFALGATAGLFLRRTLPAMAVTLAVFIAVQIFVPTTIRPDLLPSTTATFLINQATMSQADGLMTDNDSNETYVSGLSAPQGSWILSTSPIQNASGQPASVDTVNGCMPPPGPGNGQNPFSQFGACVASDNLHESMTYQPASHYWPIQWYETGIFLALAALLSGSCFWWIRRRQS